MSQTSSGEPSAPRKRAKILLLSLAAILFLLFTAFVSFTLTLEKTLQVPLDMPIAGERSGPKCEAAVVLQVTDAGIYWDKELITERELPERLAKYVKNTKNPAIRLAGDAQAKFGPTVAALDAVRKAGINNVTIETVHRSTGE